jgi:hypothetical protein
MGNTQTQPTGSTVSNVTTNYNYTVRGEMGYSSAALGGTTELPDGPAADGVEIGSTWPTIAAWDPRTSTIVGYRIGMSPSMISSANPVVTIGYDVAGRQLGEDSNGIIPQTTAPTICARGSDTSTTHFYDAEDHIQITRATTTTDKFAMSNCPEPTSNTTSVGYVWGPTGHPNMETVGFTSPASGPSGTTVTSNTTATESIHWDGDSLLYTSNVNGVDTIYLGSDAVYSIGKDAPVTTGVFSKLDRGIDGTLLGYRDAAGQVVSPAAYDPYHPNQTGSEPAANNTLNATPTGSTPEAQLGLSTNNLQIIMDQPRPDELDTYSRHARLRPQRRPMDHPRRLRRRPT